MCNLYKYKGIAEFGEDIDYLLMHYDPISLHDLLKAVEIECKFARPSFHLTFDDGLREMYDIVAPILLRKGVPATFFVNSAFMDNKALQYQHMASVLAEKIKEGLPDIVLSSLIKLLKKKGIISEDISSAIMSVPNDMKGVLNEIADCLGMESDHYLKDSRPYMDSSQIRFLIEKGFTIGSHSIDHPLYANIGFDEQVRQTVESTKWVREKYNLSYGVFAFPYTDRNVGENLLSEIRANGLVDISFGTSGMINGKLSRHLQRFSLEKPLLPAERLIALQYAKKYFLSR